MAAVSVKRSIMKEVKNNAPINVNPVGGGGGGEEVRARGGDLILETVPLSGF